jgi:hypothetical protein
MEDWHSGQLVKANTTTDNTVKVLTQQPMTLRCLMEAFNWKI